MIYERLPPVIAFEPSRAVIANVVEFTVGVVENVYVAPLFALVATILELADELMTKSVGAAVVAPDAPLVVIVHEIALLIRCVVEVEAGTHASVELTVGKP